MSKYCCVNLACKHGGFCLNCENLGEFYLNCENIEKFCINCENMGEFCINCEKFVKGRSLNLVWFTFMILGSCSTIFYLNIWSSQEFRHQKLKMVLKLRHLKFLNILKNWFRFQICKIKVKKTKFNLFKDSL